MALSEGAYLIINAGSSKCMDVKGDSDKVKANVIQYSVNNTDGQTWVLMSTKSGWQINCALSGKSLTIAGWKARNAANINQNSDKNSKAQRWTLSAVKNKSHSYRGKSYPCYLIKAKTNGKLVAGLKTNNSSNGTSVTLQTYNNTSNYQRWIFVPVSLLKSEDTYQIVLASNTKQCIGVKSGATTNGANVYPVARRNDDNYQVWKTDYDEQNGVVRFINAASGKYMSVKGSVAKAGTNIVLGSTKTAASNYLVNSNGTVEVDKIKRPAARMRTQLGNSELYVDVEGTNIRLASRSSRSDQLFAFMPSEIYGKNITKPGSISVQAPLYSNGPGSVTVSGLSFNSGYKSFQARYMLRRYYSADKTSYTDSNWMNVRDNGTGNSGWGSPRTAAFSDSSASELHSVYVSEQLKTQKVYDLSEASETKPIHIDIIYEIRAYVTNYKNQNVSNWAAHGPAQRSTVRIRQRPILTFKGVSLDVSNDSVGLKSKITNSLNLSPKAFRARIIGEDGIPISSWVTSKSEEVAHHFGSTLSRLPRDGEQITVNYVQMFLEDIVIEGSESCVFTMPVSARTLNLSFSHIDDFSEIATISCADKDSICCLMTVRDIDGDKFVKCPVLSRSGGTVIFRAAPPLNKDTTFEVYGRNGNDSFVYGSVVGRAQSHFSIWSWSENGTPLDNCAILMVNDGNPPEQTRTFTSNVNYQLPSGRKWPVAFAPLGLTADVSVSGIALDGSGGLNYEASGPIPEQASISRLVLLARLAGKGIHPIYRTPYGDWYQVAISSVDVSKSNLGYSNVKVTQSVVED